MCYPASFIVMQNVVLFDKNGNSHEVIIKNNRLTDNTHEPSFVRVEIVPPNFQYNLPFEQWEFQIDQDLLPKWFDKREAEIAVRTMLPKWWKHHANTPTCKDKQTRVITEGECVVNGGMAWFCNNTSGIVNNGEVEFHNNSIGIVNSGKAVFLNNTSGTVNGGEVEFHGNSVGIVNSGEVEFHNNSIGIVNSGKAIFLNNANGTVNNGNAEFHGNSVGTVNDGEAVFLNNASGTINGGNAWFFNNAVGTVNGGEAHIYSPHCKVVLSEGSTGKIINCF